MNARSRCRVAAALLAALVASTASGTAAPGSPRSDFIAHLDQRVPDLMRRYEVPGVAVAIVQDGVVVWSGSYGYADRPQRRPLRHDAVFRAESISKTVTAWAVMQLVERGAVDLDAPVQRYIDWRPPPARFDAGAITVRHLLTHTAGVGEWEESGAVRVVHAPGRKFRYSSAGYHLLERLVETSTGRAFDEYVTAEILTPLGMERSTYRADSALPGAQVTGHDRAGAPVMPDARAAGAAGLHTTVRDLARFVAAAMPTAAAPTERVVLRPDTLHAMQQPHTPVAGPIWRLIADGYGLGYATEVLASGHSAISHGGEGNGGINWIGAVPGTGDAFVIMTNSKRSSAVIATLVREWSTWRGLPPMKLSRSHTALSIALWLGFAGAVVAGLMIAVRVVRDVVDWRRVLTLDLHRLHTRQFVQIGIALGAAALWLLVLHAPLMHLLPLLAPLIAAALLTLAALMLLAAFAPDCA